MNTPCAICASQGTSCCSGYQIFLTPGDICRISGFLKDINFFTFESPAQGDIEPDYDTLWLPLILSANNLVRVLKRTHGKKCYLTSDNGCLLPPDKRPLICRLYPYTFLEHHFLGIDQGCPISRHGEWQSILDRMGMPLVKAEQWRYDLYKEIRETDFPGKIDRLHANRI